MTNTAIPTLPEDDPLLAALGNVTFSSTPAVGTSASVVAVPGAIDPEHAAIHQAVSAGTIPTFADDLTNERRSTPLPIDLDAERAAYVAFLAFITAHKDPNTTITVAEPDLIVKAFS
ncbi:MAG: hypothetical protein ABL893_04780 [Hyphomicrobium sp.]